MAFSITATDKAANATTAPFSVAVDNTGADGRPDDDRQHDHQRGRLDPQERRVLRLRQRDRRGQRRLHRQGQRLDDHQRADGAGADGLHHRLHGGRRHLRLQERRRRPRRRRCPRAPSSYTADAGRQGQQLDDLRRVHRHRRQHRAGLRLGGAGHGRDQRARVRRPEPRVHGLRRCVGRHQRRVRADGEGEQLHDRPDGAAAAGLRQLVQRRRRLPRATPARS